MIPKYGAVGAIIGSIAAHVFICALEGFVVRKELPVFSFIKESIPFIVAGLIMAVLVKLISKYLISGLPVIKILIAIFIGAVIYIWLGFLISKKQGLNWKEIF